MSTSPTTTPDNETLARWRFIGNAHAVRLLAHAAHTQPGHAYLFIGAPHSGRKTLARRFAQALLCQQRDAAPCGVCRACALVEHEHHPDVLMLTPETQRDLLGEKALANTYKVDTIRALQAELARRPVEGRYKVLIVANAERLTTQAANAFLKTLEEPPSFVVIILTTTDEALLLPTIRSRCQVLTLRPVPRADIEALVREQTSTPEEAALIARLSAGRVGWALQSATTPNLLNARRQAIELLHTLLTASYTDRLEHAATLAQAERLDMLHIWATWWHDVLLVAANAETAITNIDDIATLRHAAQHISREQVLVVLRKVQTTLRLLHETNVQPQLAWETLLLTFPRLTS